MDSKNERHIYLFLLLVLCLVSFGLGYYLFRTTHFKETKHIPINDTISLNAKPLIVEDVIVKNNYVGYAEAINQVQIIPYISGYLQHINIKAGQHVRENDLMITIEPGEYKARLDAAKAEVLQAEAAFEYSKNYYDRVMKSGKRAFSEIETDNAKNNFLQAEAALKNAQANQALAEVNYQYTNIKAPISGLVGNFTLSPGDYVAPNGKMLLSVVQTDPIRVVFSLTDTEYLNLKTNDKNPFKDSVIKLKLANGAPFDYEGEFQYTDNHLNKSTNSLAFYVYFKNDKTELLPNSFVTVEIYKTFKNSVSIDKNYVKMLDEGTYLTIGRNNTIETVKIDILADKGNQYVLKNTFQNGDLLILDDTANLKDNKNIRFQVIN